MSNMSAEQKHTIQANINFLNHEMPSLLMGCRMRSNEEGVIQSVVMSVHAKTGAFHHVADFIYNQDMPADHVIIVVHSKSTSMTEPATFTVEYRNDENELPLATRTVIDASFANHQQSK